MSDSLKNPFDKPMVILVVLMIIGFFFLIKDSKGYYQEEYVITQGIVSDKHIDEYACGKHKRSTCTRLYLNINNRDYVVSDYEYNGVKIGDKRILKGVNNNTPWYAVIFIISLLPCFLAAIICAPLGLAQEHINADKRKRMKGE